MSIVTHMVIRAWARICRVTRREDGAVIVIVAGSLVLFLALFALTIDLGIERAAHQRAQLAADAGALAGADDISAGTTTSASSDATAIATRNDAGSTATATTPYNGNSNSVQVGVSGNVSLPFGFPSGRVSATAVASSQPVNGFSDSDFSNPTQNNGSGSFFEEFCIVTNSFCTTANPNMGPWTITAGSVDLNGYQYIALPSPTVDPNITNNAQVVDMVGSYTNGTIQQTITTVPGRMYAVSFDLGANTHGPPTQKPLSLMANGTTIGSWTYNGPYGTDNSPAAINWAVETASFQAASNSTTIDFVSNVNNVASGADDNRTVNNSDFRYGAAITDLNITTTQDALTQ